ncbi:unnamed protein product [Peniophora sp. CBMAI 1063]|nr:unnamed protein product [Peniophora sp. CBMAI 1063]
MSEVAPPLLRFDRLPAELIALIIYYAQVAWRDEHFAAQAPYAGVKRYEVSQSPTSPSDIPSCCNGARWDFSRPTCIRSESGKGLPPSLPSPAHTITLVSRRLRGVLEGNSKIWQLDNTLYPGIARRTGEHRTAFRGRTIIVYGSRNLIALDVCACLLRGLHSFYSRLVSVKLRLPWSGDQRLATELRQFLRDNRGRANSPLLSFDLEALDPDPLHVQNGRRRRMTAFESVNLHVSRFSGGNVYYYSKTLISLYLHQGSGTSVLFGSSLSIGLSACAATIEYLTIDIDGGFLADIEGSITFLKLRYFRLCTERLFGALLLGRLVLPYALDLHLEQVESWREWFTAKHPGIYEVPFWPSEHAPACFESDWSRPEVFSQDLAEPHRTGMHHSALPPNHTAGTGDPAELLWRRSTAVMGLDVRIDPNTGPSGPAAARFPELVNVTVAETLEQLRPVLMDPVGRDACRSLELGDKLAARRSLTFRDNQLFQQDRERDFNSQYPKALYDTLQYVLALLPDERAPGSERRVHEFVFAKDSWLPDLSLGYQHILARFTALRILHFDSHLLVPNDQLKQNMEGCIAPAHLDALALFLNMPGVGNAYVCPLLQEIRLQVTQETVIKWGTRVGGWNVALNSPGRLASGARRIVLTGLLD